MKPTVLLLFNSSDYAPRPWIDDSSRPAGAADGRFNVVSVDFDDTDHSGAHSKPHYGHTVLNIDLATLWAKWDILAALHALGMSPPSLVISFAPCTDLAVSGAAHFAKKREADPQFQAKAVQMARLAEQFNCPYMVENPVSVLASLWRKPDMYWHPWEFSGYCPAGEHPEFPEVIPPKDWYNKKTGMWCGNGFVMPRKTHSKGPEGDFPGHIKLGGKSARTKYIRSLTPRGFANAIYYANVEHIINAWGKDNG